MLAPTSATLVTDSATVAKQQAENRAWQDGDYAANILHGRSAFCHPIPLRRRSDKAGLTKKKD